MTKLRIAYVPATTTLPVHVADKQGFFRANKLDVTLKEASNISNILPTLGRQFDVSLGTSTDLLRAGAAGLDVVQIAGNSVSSKENPFAQVIVRPDSGIKDFGDLGGKTLGSPTLSGVIHVGVLYSAKQQGVEPSAINGVQAPPPTLPDQLRAKRFDGVEALEPFASQLKKNDNASIGDPFSAIADPLATNFWVAKGSWARENRQVVERFVQSLEQAKEFIDQKPEEAREVLQSYTNFPPPVASSVPLPTYDFEIRTEDLGKWETVLREIGQLERDVDHEKLVLAKPE